MKQSEPCKIELKWPACCPRCGQDLRISPVTSSTAESVKPVSPATIVLKDTAKRLAQKVSPQEKLTDVEEQIDLSIIVGAQPLRPTDGIPDVSQPVKPITLPLTGRIEIASKGEDKILPLNVVPPPLPTEELKRETPPPPPSGPAPEPNAVMLKEEPAPTTTAPVQGQPTSQLRIEQYYGLLPSPVQFGQINLNPPPMLVSQHQPIWPSLWPQQQSCYQTNWYRPTLPPAVLLQQQNPGAPPQPRFIQFSAPPEVNFPFPPAAIQQQLQLQPGQSSMVPSTMVPGNGVFTVQHHYLNVLPGQFQQ